ncbi:MAG: T9SS type A sorting domain-containing protein [Prevotellaceae bacterium]|nr:T9SS type A sorting domain-containing protein [Prevotellaceae bacterium]
MKRSFALLLLIALCLAPLSVSEAQAQAIGQWQVYPAYTNATANVVMGSRVYALMERNLLCYDTEDQSVKTYNSLEDLSDVRITHLNVSTQAQRVILVYDNSNIDLLDKEDRVVNLDGLKNSSLMAKEVNAVVVEGGTAYVLTGFGFLEVDMREGVIRDTYRLEKSLTGIRFTDTYVYVSTASGVLRCARNATWNEAANWTASTDFTVAQVCYVPAEYNLAGGLYWHSDGLDGLRGYKRNADGSYAPAAGPIRPNSPVRDLFYRMQYVGDRLLVSGGVNTPYAIYQPATAMIFEDGRWSYLDEQGPKQQYPTLRHYNTTHLVQDPTDANHHFASPYRTGLYEYRDGKFTGLYNKRNSPLQDIVEKGKPLGDNYTSATALKFDGEGNLWMANQQTDTIVRVLTPQGKWHSLYYEDIVQAPTAYDYLFTTSGVNFLCSHRITNRGFFGFTTNGTLNTTRDDDHLLRQTLTNTDGTSRTPDQFYCMTEDLNGQVWCGTNLGLYIIEDPTRFFDNDFRFLQIKIARNDGSGLADYLLVDVPISCIAVDGANRKWIGTAGSGLFLVSADGQETIHHFQAKHTPLLSDNIQCLAIHPATGLVMIGTDRGLCSYMSDASQALADLDADRITAYPNPVGPDYDGLVTIDGLTQDAEVKITSSTGQLIHSGTSNGGRFTWNLRTRGGRRVSSGVYQVIANTGNGSKAVVNRIVVIK